MPAWRDDSLAFLRQHRTIVPASLGHLFSSLLWFEEWEIHKGFLYFPNFELGQKSWLSLLAKLCGIAINYSCQVSSRLDSSFGSFWWLADYLYSTKGGYSFLLIAKAFWNHQPGWWFSSSSQWGCCKNEFCNSP
jgi:hypothetical protein